MSEQTWLDLVGELAYWQRRGTMIPLVRECVARNIKNIVETGCIRGIRGDGQSTLIFAMVSARIGGKFTSIEINSTHIDTAKDWLGEFAAGVNWVCADSVTALRAMNQPIDLLYLDSLDWSEQKPIGSQLHQAAELVSAYEKLTSNSMIVLDDAGAKTVLTEHLLDKLGWHQIYSGHQLVFSRT